METLLLSDAPNTLKRVKITTKNLCGSSYKLLKLAYFEAPKIVPVSSGAHTVKS